jgi:hypothetical protein
MKITSSLSSDTYNTHLEYDAETQDALRKAWPLVRATLRDPVVAKNSKAQGCVYQSRMKAGGKVLSNLAAANEHFELAVLDLTAAADVVMFVANYRAAFKMPVSTLPEVVLLLSRVTPYFLPNLPLIPAAEVFDLSHVGSSAWNSYERVRQIRKSEPQGLTLMEMYELLLVLRQLHQNNIQLYALEKCLDQFTSMYRCCLEALAAAELLNVKVSRERKPRQA